MKKQPISIEGRITSLKISGNRRILNCIGSRNQHDDWTIDGAFQMGIVSQDKPITDNFDLREPWWTIQDQEETGACVGFAVAGILRWHFYKKNMIQENQNLSARYIWMANKETDEMVSFPTVFIEKSGTQTKVALSVIRKWGCILEDFFGWNDKTYPGTEYEFYKLAAKYRITSYFNLGTDLTEWRRWIHQQGPILTRLDVDYNWLAASPDAYELLEYGENLNYGHAAVIVGYSPDGFIIRNSWGTKWGNQGFVFVSNSYASKAFTEAYGVEV